MAIGAVKCPSTRAGTIFERSLRIVCRSQRHFLGYVNCKQALLNELWHLQLVMPLINVQLIGHKTLDSSRTPDMAQQTLAATGMVPSLCAHLPGPPRLNRQLGFASHVGLQYRLGLLFIPHIVVNAKLVPQQMQNLRFQMSLRLWISHFPVEAHRLGQYGVGRKTKCS